MPKLYFYDTGLTCSLLGITSSEQLKYHYFTGPLFENLVISELIKSRFNKALNNNLFFWRDNTGNEIDVLIDESQRLYPVVVKYGQTITLDFFKSLLFWKKISQFESGTVVYGGEDHQKRSNGIEVLPWNKAGKLMDQS